MKYELSQHARDAMSERGIPTEWMERVLDRPDKTEPDRADSVAIHHLGTIVEYGNRVLRVVINKQASPVRIVTVYFDRKMKGTL